MKLKCWKRRKSRSKTSWVFTHDRFWKFSRLKATTMIRFNRFCKFSWFSVSLKINFQFSKFFFVSKISTVLFYVKKFDFLGHKIKSYTRRFMRKIRRSGSWRSRLKICSKFRGILLNVLAQHFSWSSKFMETPPKTDLKDASKKRKSEMKKTSSEKSILKPPAQASSAPTVSKDPSKSKKQARFKSDSSILRRKISQNFDKSSKDEKLSNSTIFSSSFQDLASNSDKTSFQSSSYKSSNPQVSQRNVATNYSANDFCKFYW